jgi:hypothetical protein
MFIIYIYKYGGRKCRHEGRERETREIKRHDGTKKDKRGMRRGRIH